MEIEILETERQIFTTHDEDQAKDCRSWHGCKITKTEYGSVIVETGKYYVISNQIIEFYPSSIKQIFYKK